MKKAYVFLADGFETIEGVSPVDILRRCGVDVKTVSISESCNVMCSHGVKMLTDLAAGSGSDAANSKTERRKTETKIRRIGEEYLSENVKKIIDEGDMIILPGGYPGYINLGNSQIVKRIVTEYWNNGKWVAAICGAPAAIAKFGIAKGARITCHFSVKDKMRDYIFTGKSVEQDKNLITGRGAGLSIEFAIRLASVLTDEETVRTLIHKLEIQ